MDDKIEAVPFIAQEDSPKKKQNRGPNLLLGLACGLVLLDLGTRWVGSHRDILPKWHGQHKDCGLPSTPITEVREPGVVDYTLTLSQAWRNPDGGWWRPMFVGNSETPFETIHAQEGDIVKIHMFNELQLPWAIHWLGLDSGSETWNDGSAGVTTYPLLPRANRTAVFNTTGQWGLKRCLDHVSVPSVEGNYGTMWIRPSPNRERPYSVISDDKQDVQDMLEAEVRPHPVTVYNYQHRQAAGLIAQLQAEGHDPYCFQSVLINGKGRVHCKPPQLDKLDGKPLDTYGCVPQASGAVGYGECKPSNGDYEIIHTDNRRWILLQFTNTGFEHVWRISIDNHKMWIVANDGGFVQPQEVDVLHLIDADTIHVMIRLDQPAQDYAVRFYSYSKMQSIQGFAYLRYPHRRMGQTIGEPMPQPKLENGPVNLDGTVKKGFVLQEVDKLAPFTPNKPDQKADLTLRLKATGAPDPVNPFVTNCSLNGAPWQLFREFMEPVALHVKEQSSEPEPIIRNLPLGSVVDIILENDLPVDLPFYKHNNPTFKIDWDTKKSFNLENPTYGYMHELPAGGWLALRWKINRPAATMFTVYKVRYFIQGMQVALLEGDDAPWPELPKEQRELPHVDFPIPPRCGIFD
ncbi:hypothetical protein CB0940_04256 [Cercospora beticola]|uniref:Multicopper oxidase n=1 Tax=Cercospora beticola TaxID=122368 RepID=A0A2G5HLX8_CERBT|nr:hypothetical protein CB0940_04256 [Cercospora beticola]PIA93508.1 hypothetical protein CB0940_04256 [Cercospora beticola]WPB01479.1 hypothetical protein RHO25_006105 [Cercospora beticola]